MGSGWRADARVFTVCFALAASAVHADEKSAHLDDDFVQQLAAQVALAIQAQQCELRSSVWLNKLIDSAERRLSKHFREVRPTWTETEDDAIAGQIIYGAIYGAKSDISAPPVVLTDIMKLGEQNLARSMACQLVTYHKSDLLYLDRIVEDGNS